MPDFATFKRWVSADWKAHASWRAEARENFAFAAGDQWSDEDKQMLAEQNRVPIVFNRTATIINAVAGSEINNRTEVRFFPRTLGDAEINEVLTKGAEWYRDQAQAEEEESQAFGDTLICGLGWTESILDFETDSDGEPRMTRINPLEMCWDSSAERRGLVDAHRIARVREMTIEAAEDQFEGKEGEDLDAAWLDVERGDGEATPQWSDDDYSHEDDGDAEDKDIKRTVTVVQLQYKQRRREVEYADPRTGQRGRMGKREWVRLMDQLRERGMDANWPTRDVVTWEWRQVFLGGDILLENQPCRDAPTFTPITGYWDNARRQWYGLLRQIKDPQMYANKWLSQTLHIINANSKGGVMAEFGAVDDPARFEEDWAAADSVIWLRDGAIAAGKVQPKPQAQMPTAFMSLIEFFISSIRDVSGVNQELLGMRDQNQPGVLEYQRKQAAMTTLAVLFDALRLYRKQQGKVLLFYMTEYLADGRLIRISDEAGERYEPLMVDPTITKYDVIIDDAPTSPNNKERVWEIIMQLMPVLTQAGLPPTVWGEIIEYAPFPAALIEKLKEVAQKPQQPDPMADQAQKLALAEMAAKIEKDRAAAQRDLANADENTAQAFLALSKAQSEPQMAEMEMMKDLAQAQSARVKAGVDVHKANVDLTKARMDLSGRVMDLRSRQTQPAPYRR